MKTNRPNQWSGLAGANLINRILVFTILGAMVAICAWWVLFA